MKRIPIILAAIMTSAVFAIDNDNEDIQSLERDNGTGAENQTTVAPVDPDRVQEIRKMKQVRDMDLLKRQIQIAKDKQEQIGQETKKNSPGSAQKGQPRKHRATGEQSQFEKHFDNLRVDRQKIVDSARKEHTPNGFLSVKHKIEQQRSLLKKRHLKDIPTFQEQIKGTFRTTEKGQYRQEVNALKRVVAPQRTEKSSLGPIDHYNNEEFINSLKGLRAPLIETDPRPVSLDQEGRRPRSSRAPGAAYGVLLQNVFGPLNSDQQMGSVSSYTDRDGNLSLSVDMSEFEHSGGYYVEVAGSWNDYATGGDEENTWSMEPYDDENVWEVTLNVPDGTYLYAFGVLDMDTDTLVAVGGAPEECGTSGFFMDIFGIYEYSVTVSGEDVEVGVCFGECGPCGVFEGDNELLLFDGYELHPDASINGINASFSIEEGAGVEEDESALTWVEDLDGDLSVAWFEFGENELLDLSDVFGANDASLWFEFNTLYLSLIHI